MSQSHVFISDHELKGEKHLFWPLESVTGPVAKQEHQLRESLFLKCCTIHGDQEVEGDGQGQSGVTKVTALTYLFCTRSICFRLVLKS